MDHMQDVSLLTSDLTMSVLAMTSVVALMSSKIFVLTVQQQQEQEQQQAWACLLTSHWSKPVIFSL